MVEEEQNISRVPWVLSLLNVEFSSFIVDQNKIIIFMSLLSPSEQLSLSLGAWGSYKLSSEKHSLVVFVPPQSVSYTTSVVVVLSSSSCSSGAAAALQCSVYCLKRFMYLCTCTSQVYPKVSASTREHLIRVAFGNDLNRLLCMTKSNTDSRAFRPLCVDCVLRAFRGTRCKFLSSLVNGVIFRRVV